MSQPKVIDKRGMDAIFSGVGTPKSEVSSQDKVVMTTETGINSMESVVTTKDTGIISRESGIGTPEYGLNVSILNQAIKQGTENPRISSWNPLVMAVLRYRNLTIPAYSMSKEISELLETAVRKKYPELSKQVEKALAKK
jgi:hypothetical protein